MEAMTTDRTLFVSTESEENVSTEPEPYAEPFDSATATTFTIIFVSMGVIGVVANVVTIVAILKSKDLKSLFLIFLVSLCVSDLLSAIISPLAIYRLTWGHEEWKIPEFLCKFYWGMDNMTSFATAHHIFCYSLLRLFYIAKPHFFKKITKRQVMVAIAIIWLTCFLSGFVIYFWWFGKIDRPRLHKFRTWPGCALKTEWFPVLRWYVWFCNVFHVYLPLIGIAACCTGTAIVIWRRRPQRKQETQGYRTNEAYLKEKSAVIQLGLIVSSFMLGYLPEMAYKLRIVNTGKSDWTSRVMVYLCLRTSECLNPVFYNLGSMKVRKATLSLLQQCGLMRHCTREEQTSRTNQHSTILSDFSQPRTTRVRSTA